MKSARACCTAMLLILSAIPAFAHHGKDFLLLQSADVPHPHSLFFISVDTFNRGNDGVRYEGEPALLYGVTERIAAELHAHIAKEGGDALRVEAISPSVHFQFPQPSGPTSWRFGLNAEYELSRNTEEED